MLAAPASVLVQQPPSRHVVLITIDGFAAFHLDNPGIDLPNVRELAAAGARAGSSLTVFPSVTHPAHTTLITGVMPRQHGVVNNRVVDRRTGQRFHITNLPRKTSIRVPTLFDAARKRGLRTAAFFWPETLDDEAIDDNFAEVFDDKDKADPTRVSPTLLAWLRQEGLPIDTYFSYYDDGFAQAGADLALTNAAAHVLKVRKPAFLAVHLLITDKVQHEVGPDHYRAHAALSAADHAVGLLRKAARDAGIDARTTFIIAADHGFVTVRNELNLGPVLEEPSLAGRVRWLAESWYVWGERLAGFDQARDGPALERVLARAAATEHIARIVRPDELAGLGYPDYADNPYVPGHYLIAADVDTHLVIDSGPTQYRRRAQPYHGHGYFPEHRSMRAALVLSGAGIAKGVDLGEVRNVDVAPTIAALLGLDLPGATGRALNAALSSAAISK